MKTLTIIRGCPGSGKSTLARNMWSDCWDMNVSVSMWEADLFMIDRDGNYCFDPSRLKECHAKCQHAVEYDMSCGREEVIVSNTFTRLWEMEFYLRKAAEYGYDVEVIHCVDRFESIHGVPNETVERMLAQYEPYPGEEIYSSKGSEA